MNNIVRNLREKNSLTQQDLADQLGVSRQTIISLENGKYNPSIMLAYRLAKIFSLTIEDVFLFEEE
ncbi:MAG: helix-turn-helix transcriptional regulator [Cellulosilyticaceae bacterium]